MKNAITLKAIADGLAEGAGLPLTVQRCGPCGSGDSEVVKEVLLKEVGDCADFLGRIARLQSQGFRAAEVAWGPAYRESEDETHCSAVRAKYPDWRPNPARMPEAVLVRMAIGRAGARHYHPDLGNYTSPGLRPKVGREIPTP